MATPSNIAVDTTNTGLLGLPQTEEAAAQVSWLLQKDMETHHIFFNASGFHNHIVHHLLALYGTGAGASQITRAYRDNDSYQQPLGSCDPAIVASLSSFAEAKRYLGEGRHYSSFLRFFQDEILRLGGWRNMLLEHVFSGTERAEDMLVRLHGGFLHPIIHLMYGLEWEQPAIVAQALAQAAVHKDRLRSFLLGAEKKGKDDEERDGSDEKKTMGWILDLLVDARADETLRTSARWGDDQKITDGVLTRAKSQMMRLAKKVKVKEDEMESRTWEMYDVALWMTLGSAGCMPGKMEKVDFFLMHHVNSCPIYPLLLTKSFSWLPPATKARLLEWKIRLDLIQYVARGAPELALPSVHKPLPAREALEKLHALEDDGHAIKLGRAMEVFGKLAPGPGRGGGGVGNCHDKIGWTRHFDVAGTEGVWEGLLGMVVESTGRKGEGRWVRSVGMEEAWKDIPYKPISA